MTPRIRLRDFRPEDGLDRGTTRRIEVAWYAAKVIFFLTAIPWPSRLKCRILRWFGADIGDRVLIRPRVNVHMPWKLAIGDDCWIGEGVWILNLEPADIGNNVCISQGAFICTGNHDYRSTNMRYRNAPIKIEDEAWIGARALVGPGVAVGSQAVVTAGSVVTSNVASATIASTTQRRSNRPRW